MIRRKSIHLNFKIQCLGGLVSAFSTCAGYIGGHVVNLFNLSRNKKSHSGINKVAEINVRLRVVGVYFNQRFIFDDGAKSVTIETLHNEAMLKCPINKPGGIFFTGSFEQPDGSTPIMGNPIRTISHNYSGKYDFNGNGSLEDPVDGSTLSGRNRTEGIYELSEQIIENGLLAWQYYVNRGGKIVSRTPKERGFNPYQDFILKDQDLVTWRLVSIATKPLGSNRELRLRK